MSWMKWLRPGLHVKRWLVLFVVGTVFTALGIAYVAIHIYRQEPFPAVVYYVTLQFIDQLWRGALVHNRRAPRWAYSPSGSSAGRC